MDFMPTLHMRPIAYFSQPKKASLIFIVFHATSHNFGAMLMRTTNTRGIYVGYA